MVVLAENQDYIVHWNEISHGDDLLITFSHMDFAPVETTFWGEKPASTANIPCIGIVARANHWYPNTLGGISPHIDNIADRFNRRIGYGFSMGAYGALKNSKLMALDVVIALSPQYSIDPADGDLRFSNNFTGGSGHSIRPSDCSGTAALLYDPSFPEDRVAAENISHVHPDPIHIPMLYVGHDTSQVLAGSEQFQALLNAARLKSWDTLRRTTTVYRRRSTWRIVGLWQELRRRSGDHHAFIQKHWEKLDDWWQQNLTEIHPDYTFPARRRS